MLARRVLVPLAVVTLGLALWLLPEGGDSSGPVLASDVRRCSDNLRALYAGLLEYRRRTGHAPRDAGVAFLAELIASGVWDDTPANRARLTCPGPGAAPVPEGVDYSDVGTLTEADSAYAGRDTQAFPLEKFPSGGAELEPLAACDDAHGPNHAGCLNVLFSDGSVRTLVLADEIASGRLPADTAVIPVGPGSPLPELRKLRAD